MTTERQVRKNSEIFAEASTTNIRSPGGADFGAENELETKGKIDIIMSQTGNVQFGMQN